MTGAVLAVEIRAGFYLDSVALMRISRAVSDLPGVAEAALMIGTEANKSLLRDAGLLDSRGEGAGPDDLIVAMRAGDEAAIARARTLAIELLDAPRAAAGAR
ncbi:MAG: oxidoreductase, partial [Alphaproteobacteria bacterium]|nr:oxidoreductase [Alphaproteobacteria bacterium]